MSRIALFCAALAALLSALFAPARAQDSPADMLAAHFAAISAGDYIAADHYFSAAFLRAFKPDVAALNAYYLTRAAQLAPGYSVLAVEPLADEKLEAVVLTVEFSDPHPEAPVAVSERIYYFLIREKVPAGAAGRAADGLAWRIDVFDALKFETLADARRRPYLYTSEAWADDISSELKSRQGLFRIQQALSMYFTENGDYPLRLLGADNRRDELIAGQHLLERYPPCGFDTRPMRAMEFNERSSGDFSYYSVDADGDERHEGYWLLLHGKVPEHYYFEGEDTIYILNESLNAGQRELAEAFADFWAARGGAPPQLSPTFLDAQAALEAQSPVLGSMQLAVASPPSGEQPAAPAADITAAAAGLVNDQQPAPPDPPRTRRADMLASWVKGIARKLLPAAPAPPAEIPPLTVISPSSEALSVRSFGFR